MSQTVRKSENARRHPEGLISIIRDKLCGKDRTFCRNVNPLRVRGMDAIHRAAFSFNRAKLELEVNE